jgi:hypothetical protein
METFRTLVNPAVSPCRIGYAASLMALGSCFAESIGKQLLQLKFNVLTNPHGIVFHPLPLARQMARMMTGEPYTADELTYCNGLWGSFDHHGRFSHPDAGVCLNRINAELRQGCSRLTEAEWIFVTFGTAWAYRLKDSGKFVANCHHYPASHFERIRTNAEEIGVCWETTLAALRRINPRVRVVFTVSPVRHTGDAHENQLGKSALLLAVDRIVHTMPEYATYFPAYEIMLDDLRDYRFYSEDMAHPSGQAIRYIWKKFCDTFLSDETRAITDEVESVVKAAAHRPVHMNETTAVFASELCRKINRLQQRFPNMDFTGEIHALEQILSAVRNYAESQNHGTPPAES